MESKTSKTQQPQDHLGDSQKFKILGAPYPLSQNLHFNQIPR